MIAQAELDRALARWKARRAGHDVGNAGAHDGVVEAEVEATVVHTGDLSQEILGEEMYTETGSGLITIEPGPEGDE